MPRFDGRPAVRALAFDVFGTVVDWRGSVAREAAAMAAERGIDGDWEAFADAWRAGYAPAMDRVRRGELPWMNIDALHRLILDSIVERFGLGGLGEAERAHLNHAWHRLAPWPDGVEGRARLKRRFTITTLSNGNFSLLVDLARHAGLPWDCVISAELFGHYKPDPETYQGGSRSRRVPSSPGWPRPSRCASAGTSNGRDCWSGMRRTALWPATTSRPGRWISSWVRRSCTALPLGR